MSDIEIEKICKRYGVKNYTIKDGLVNVDGDVRLINKGLTGLPITFGEVTGNFYCQENKLTNLKGSPISVGDNFYCYYNQLTSLEGSTQHINGYFDCSDNILTDLKGSPRYVNDGFICSRNLLTDFKGCPDEVEGEFFCGINNIYSLDGLLFKRININGINANPITGLYNKYRLDNYYHREFIIEADVIRPPDEIGGLPIINKDRMDWFTQTYGLEEFKGDKNYKLQL